MAWNSEIAGLPPPPVPAPRLDVTVPRPQLKFRVSLARAPLAGSLRDGLVNATERLGYWQRTPSQVCEAWRADYEDVLERCIRDAVTCLARYRELLRRAGSSMALSTRPKARIPWQQQVFRSDAVLLLQYLWVCFLHARVVACLVVLGCGMKGSRTTKPFRGCGYGDFARYQKHGRIMTPTHSAEKKPPLKPDRCPAGVSALVFFS